MSRAKRKWGHPEAYLRSDCSARMVAGAKFSGRSVGSLSRLLVILRKLSLVCKRLRGVGLCLRAHLDLSGELESVDRDEFNRLQDTVVRRIIEMVNHRDERSLGERRYLSGKNIR